MKNLNVVISNSCKYYVLIDVVFIGENKFILCFRVVDFNGWDFKVINDIIIVMFFKF